jgi:casein kinase II subunit beta
MTEDNFHKASKNMPEGLDESDESSASGSYEFASWIAWFCSLKGNELLCEVDEEYIQDPFNLTGLSAMVPYYEEAIGVILDDDVTFEGYTEEQQQIAENAAEMLYGMIHSRFIVTTRGLQLMAEKYKEATFGRCPKVQCNGESMLPVGRHDLPRRFSVNVFCPRCQELYYPKSSRQGSMDGAYFGTTFPHLFLLTYPEYTPPREERENLQKYVPKVFGFKIFKESVYYAGRPTSESRVNRNTDGNTVTNTNQNQLNNDDQEEQEQEFGGRNEDEDDKKQKKKTPQRSALFNPFTKRNLPS